MGRYRLFTALLLMSLACRSVRATDDFSDLSDTIASLMGSGSALSNFTSLLGTSSSNSILSSLGTSGLSSFLSNLTTSDILKSFTKVATVAATTKIVKESDFWADLQTSIDSMDDLFTSLPQTQYLISLASGLLNGTKDVLHDAWEEGKALEEKYCTPAFVVEKEEVPTACVGYTLTLAIGGGFCIFQEDKSIRCRKPSVRLVKTPTECLLKHHEAVVIKTKECKIVKTWGESKAGFLHPHSGPKVYNVTKTLADAGILDEVDSKWSDVISVVAQKYDSIGDKVASAAEGVKSWLEDKFTLHWFD